LAGESHQQEEASGSSMVLIWQTLVEVLRKQYFIIVTINNSPLFEPC
jgi:hypothetical protein